MGWRHPQISMEEVVNLIKGFVDILILLSGYQSSGRIAHWDSHNVKKAFQWGLFFEQVKFSLLFRNLFRLSNKGISEFHCSFIWVPKDEILFRCYYQVFGSFSSDDYASSVEELDAALSEMTSAASFPKV